jgi:hypothetical protein
LKPAETIWNRLKPFETTSSCLFPDPLIPNHPIDPLLNTVARSLAVPSYSQAAVSNAVRQAGRDTRGLPSAEDVVAAIHGNLSGARRKKWGKEQILENLDGPQD